MLRCSKEAFAVCPTAHICGSREDSTFTEGSDCDKFNQAVANSCKLVITNGDRIRAMNNYELAVFLAKAKADLGFNDRLVVAYSAKDMADCLEWLEQPVEEESE